MVSWIAGRFFTNWAIQGVVFSMFTEVFSDFRFIWVIFKTNQVLTSSLSPFFPFSAHQPTNLLSIYTDFYIYFIDFYIFYIFCVYIDYSGHFLEIRLKKFSSISSVPSFSLSIKGISLSHVLLVSTDMIMLFFFILVNQNFQKWRSNWDKEAFI